MEEYTQVLFTDSNGRVVRTTINVELNLLEPKFLLFNGKLYRFKGWGGGTGTFFYHEVPNFEVVAN